MKPRKPNKLARKGKPAEDKTVPRILGGHDPVLRSFAELRERLHNDQFLRQDDED